MSEEREFKPGDRVRVTGSHTDPLLGCEGVVAAADGRSIIVRLNGKPGRYMFGASALTLSSGRAP